MANSTRTGVSIPFFAPDERQHRRNIADWAQWANQGHLANVGNVTLGASTVSTVVADSRVSVNSWVGLAPRTADALSAQPTVFVSTVMDGTFTITHSSSVSTTKTFKYALLG